MNVAGPPAKSVWATQPIGGLNVTLPEVATYASTADVMTSNYATGDQISSEKRPPFTVAVFLDSRTNAISVA
jgi:hypothetical protein